MNTLKVSMTLPKKLKSVFSDKARYRGAYGGRGSAKSWSFARMLLLKAIQKPTRILCARELQNSIKDSVHRILVDQMYQLGIQNHFNWGQAFLNGKNGSEFIFRGLRHNYREIKSMEGIDICWVEEAESVSAPSWRVLKPTIRKSGSEIWLTWNSESIDAPVHQDFVLNPPKDARIVMMNWRDNPWFTEELEKERLCDLSKDPDLYAHIWEGECLTRSESQVLYGKWKIDRFERPKLDKEITGGPYFGCDWGFSTDPMALTCSYIIGKNLFIEYEAGGQGVAIKDMYKKFDEIPDAKKNLFRADSSRPELINHMVSEGYKVVKARKWDGCVEDGIAHFRSYDKIIIHERCVNTAREARLWSYKIDRLTDQVLPVLVPLYDHYMDATRYALTPLIRRKRAGAWGSQKKARK